LHQGTSRSRSGRSACPQHCRTGPPQPPGPGSVAAGRRWSARRPSWAVSSSSAPTARSTRCRASAPPFEEQVVDRSRPALLQSLADLDDYHAAKGRFQVVVDLERDVRNVPAWVKGERTTYLAVGSVDALVDMGALSGDAVQTDGTSATITLPAPTLDDARLDLAESRVLDRDRGLVDRVAGAFSDDPTSEREVALVAEDRLTAAAVESDLLARAEASTRAMLTGLAGSFGYDDVTVRFEGAADPA
jgi:hypothetical protein